MERTSTTEGAPWRQNRRLLAYCVGFIVLTNLLTIAFVFALRRSPRAPAPVILERIQPGASEPGQAEHAQGEIRRVRVTSRPEGAVVTYQGQAQGTTPLRIDLPAHAAAALAIEKEGYRPREVMVEPGQAKVHVRLVRSRARQSGRSGGRREAPAAGESGEDGQAEPGAAATQEPTARTPAAPRSARPSARRRSSDPDAWTSNGAHAGAAASQDLPAE